MSPPTEDDGLFVQALVEHLWHTLADHFGPQPSSHEKLAFVIAELATTNAMMRKTQRELKEEIAELRAEMKKVLS